MDALFPPRVLPACLEMELYTSGQSKAFEVGCENYVDG